MEIALVGGKDNYFGGVANSRDHSNKKPTFLHPKELCCDISDTSTAPVQNQCIG